jgi:aminoglycoside N3'-acetyltransferase
MAMNRMREASVTHDSIVQGLRELGVVRGAIVEVHASLSAFGYVEGGAETVIAALMAVISDEGAIVMPAYPVSPAVPLTEEDRSRGVTWKVRKLAFNSSNRTGMGLIADTFRDHPGVFCGSVFHRNCSWGTAAHKYCNGYDALIADDGWCLLLGVGIDRCSSMHVAENIPVPPEIGACWEIPDLVQRAYDPGVWAIGYGGTPGDAWQKVWQRADHSGLIRHGFIGQANCHFFKLKPVVSIYQRWRRDDPYGLYEVPRLRHENGGCR